MKKLFWWILAVLGVTACQVEELAQGQSEANDAEIYASMEAIDATKTSMDQNKDVLWSEGDQIMAFLKTTLGAKYQIKEQYIGTSMGGFSKVDATGSGDDLDPGQDIGHNVAVYPYSDALWCMANDGDSPAKSYKMNVVLPQTQSYAENSFADDAFPMVAVSSSNRFTFKNICGGIKLQLKGDGEIKSIKLEGLENERISGKASVIGYVDGMSPSITMDPEASSYVILDCGDGVKINPNSSVTFVIVVPPVEFRSGLKLTVTDTAGNTKTLTNVSANTVRRSSLLTFPVITLMEEDYVDEYGVNNGPGIKIGQTVWAPVNCGYHASDFKYGKLYQWGRKYGQGYDGTYEKQYDDSERPWLKEGPVDLETGQSKSNERYFYWHYLSSGSGNWLSPARNDLWNAGTETAPIKTEYDPCPPGWRVPTYAELKELMKNHSSETKNEAGLKGFWFSGEEAYTAAAPQIFLCKSGYRRNRDGDAYSRESYGYYWSSKSNGSDLLPNADGVYFYGSNKVYNTSQACAYGCSVRCVKQ